MLTIGEINKLNQRFWEHENMLRERRIRDPAIQEAALPRLADEQLRGIPIYYQTTLEKLLADAEADKSRFLSQQGRNGGQVKKSDALQHAILDLARRDPDITAAELKNMLTREVSRANRRCRGRTHIFCAAGRIKGRANQDYSRVRLEAPALARQENSEIALTGCRDLRAVAF